MQKPLSKCPSEEISARIVIQDLTNDVLQAQDNLLQAKVQQAFQSNKNRGLEVEYKIGDKVMLTMLHRHNDYKCKNQLQVTKLMPRRDGPYTYHTQHSPRIFLLYIGSA